MKYTAIVLAALFAFAGVAVACVELRDHVTVPPSDTLGLVVEVSPESLTITNAKREVQTVVDSTNRWVEFRTEDINKREELVLFAEGLFSSGSVALLGEVGAMAGPFAPLLTLLAGYSIKRRKDRTPDEVAKEKQQSYNKGLEVGEAIAKSIKNA